MNGISMQYKVYIKQPTTTALHVIDKNKYVYLYNDNRDDATTTPMIAEEEPNSIMWIPKHRILIGLVMYCTPFWLVCASDLNTHYSINRMSRYNTYITAAITSTIQMRWPLLLICNRTQEKEKIDHMLWVHFYKTACVITWEYQCIYYLLVVYMYYVYYQC